MEPSYVPKDITTYEEKILFGLSTRQIIWAGIALVVGLSFYSVTYMVIHIPQDFCIYGTIGICIGIFAMGWAKWQNKRPYSEKVKMMYLFRTLKQRVLYSNECYYFKKKGGDADAFKKSREDKQINKEYCTETRK